MKNYRYFLLLLILALGAVWLIARRGSQTMSAADTRFAFKDTAAITKIFIRDRDGRTATLTREAGGTWRANGNSNARPDGIANLLNTIYKVFVVKPVPRTAYDNVMESFRNPAKTVEIYTTDPQKPAHKYAICPAPQKVGTYMLLDGSQEPFVVGVPAFEGSLIQRYITHAEQWRSRSVLDYQPDQVAWIKADYRLQPEHSFMLRVNDNAKNDYTIEPLSAQYARPNARSRAMAIDSLLWSLHDKSVETYVNDYPQLDSLEKATPYCHYTVGGKDGSRQTLIVFLAPITRRAKQQSDGKGNLLQYDNERYFAFVNEGKSLAIIQRYVFDNALKKYSDLVE
ncbi:MAG: hypothetical protein IT273_12875 [Chitinophagales bacterium]|nr:hypothetical protein [Chitinophagales bacterium]